jgi:hypothetical protein
MTGSCVQFPFPDATASPACGALWCPSTCYHCLTLVFHMLRASHSGVRHMCSTPVPHQVLPSDAGMTAAARVAGVELVRLRLPDGVGAGLLHVEIQHGAPG